MSHGGRIAAAVRAHEKHEEEMEAHEAPKQPVTQRFQEFTEGDDDEDAAHAQQIVKELYHRYEKQLQRWRDYRTLFAFLGFIAWYLATLYMQRQASVAYMVHSTLDDVLNPGTKAMQSTDEVYNWLSSTLTAVWVDPVCGDGICESPWEFASYSSFGCRADCGKLQDVQNLTAIQVDLNWNFGHPLGSTPASNLMQQTLWNLCPFTTPFTSACYYSSDNTFTQLSGTSSYPILDAPDGQWTVDVKNDIFDKVGGSVRSTFLVSNASYYVKNYVAVASVLAEMDLEERLLTSASYYGTQSLFSYVNQTLSSNFTNATDNALKLQQYINATCACGSFFNTSSNATFLTAAFAMLNISLDPANPAAGVFQMPIDNNNYVSRYCLGQIPGGPKGTAQLFENATYNLTVVNATNATIAINGVSKYYGPVPTTLGAGNTYITLTDQWEPAHDMNGTCTRLLTGLTAWRAQHLRRLQNFTIDWRLGDGSKTGKISARNAVFNQLQQYVLANASELFLPVFSQPYGTTAAGAGAITARVDVLQNYYILGPYFYTNPMPASAAITRTAVYLTPNITTPAIAALATARLAELRALREATLGITIPPPTSHYSPKTLGVLLGQFMAAGASSPLTWNLSSASVTLPDMNSTALGDLRTEYNFVTWTGNTTSYMQCNLPGRGPAYLGTCVALNQTCTISANDTAPYNCTSGPGSTAPYPASLPYNLSNVAYRSLCEMPCNRYYDCQQLCECWGSCKTTEMCRCDACTALASDASTDQNFIDIATASNLGTAAVAALIAPVPASAASHHRRGLQQTTDLSQVLTQVNTVQQQQTALQAQTLALQASVDRSNALAQARANDDSLLNLITQGRQDIANNQQAIMTKLDVIIGKQNQSLALAQQSQAALSNIQNLAAQQAAAQQALANAVMQQVTAIKSATSSHIISITQALALWKKARRDQAYTSKAALLATQPCNNVPAVHNNFTLDNGYATTIKTPRERNVGLTNRVVGGMLLHQTRTNETNCTDSKFNRIQQTCTGPRTLKAYGVDPVFKMGTTLYSPDLDDVNHTLVTAFYDCTQLSVATYGITVLNQTVNPAPYCAELYNPEQLPYSFYYYPMDGKQSGFPVWLDINLGAADAAQWESYIQQGLYLDTNTQELTVELITYNAPLRIFGYLNVDFAFSEGGSIDVTYRLDTVRVELYNGYDDNVRLFMEIVLNIMVFGMLLWTFWLIAMTQRERRNALKYFSRAWNVIDFLSNALLASCCILWWVFVSKYARVFDISLRYEVYPDLEPTANYLALANNGAGLTQAWSDFSALISLVDMLNWYFALNGINILLLIARLLKLMDFQPRLGVVTRSLWLAGPDLIHFAIVAGMVFVGYAMMAHLIFGNVIEKFSTFGISINTCFEILLGNIDVNTELRALGGLQQVAGTLFFWSYELLVFMVLLNFLLAIIVDAFSEVKTKQEETAGIHTELWMMFRDKWRSLMGSCSSNYISDAKLGLLLKQWAGEDKGTAEDKQAQAEHVKLLTVLNEDLDEEDLRSVLMECLKDAPEHDEDDKGGKEPNKAAAMARRVFCLPSGRRVVATPREIELAAHYIVDRFGVKVAQEEEAKEEGAENRVEAADAPKALAAAPRNELAERERDQLASALERLADVQRELADGQRNLMTGQRQLAEQQAKLITLMNSEAQG